MRNGGSINVFFIKFFEKKFSNSTYGYYCRCSKARWNCKREIQHVENELRQGRRTLTALFWRHRLPANPAVVENHIHATDQRTRFLESRLIMLLKEREDLIVRAVTRGHRRGVKALSTLFSFLRLKLNKCLTTFVFMSGVLCLFLVGISYGAYLR